MNRRERKRFHKAELEEVRREAVQRPTQSDVGDCSRERKWVYEKIRESEDARGLKIDDSTRLSDAFIQLTGFAAVRAFGRPVLLDYANPTVGMLVAALEPSRADARES